MATLLTTGNPKTAKGEGLGYLTAILHLAPLRIAGRENICPWASKGCAAACLNTAGRGGIFRKGEHTNTIQEARKRKTRLFFDDGPAFMTQLAKEIGAHARRAERHGMRPAVRLNGTSDVRWENTYLLLPDGTSGTIFEAFPSVQFYDYTKSIDRAWYMATNSLPRNYHLTFSRNEANEAEAIQALEMGVSVAIAFDTKKGWELPEDWNGWAVIDGDRTDLRFLDGPGVVVGLRAKGKARKDTTGFVVSETETRA